MPAIKGSKFKNTKGNILRAKLKLDPTALLEKKRKHCTTRKNTGKSNIYFLDGEEKILISCQQVVNIINEELRSRYGS